MALYCNRSCALYTSFILLSCNTTMYLKGCCFRYTIVTKSSKSLFQSIFENDSNLQHSCYAAKTAMTFFHPDVGDFSWQQTLTKKAVAPGAAVNLRGVCRRSGATMQTVLLLSLPLPTLPEPRTPCSVVAECQVLECSLHFCTQHQKSHIC